MSWSAWATTLHSLAVPLLVVFFAYVFVCICRLRAVRGSRQRMVLRTIERPMRWVAATALMLQLLRSIVEVDVLGLISSPVAIVIWTKVWSLDRGDDDDFWRTCAGKIKSWFRSGSVRGGLPARS